VRPREYDMELNREQTRTGLCYHEAAHAVFAYHARLPVQHVVVTEELEAMCVTSLLPKPYPRQGLELATIYLAGEHALWKRCGQEILHMPFNEFTVVAGTEAEDPADGLGGHAGDHAGALELVRLAANNPASAWGGIESCYQEACRIAASKVGIWWEEIIVIAERLREIGYLDGPECATLIEEVARSR
jgi:hypothetical protein